MLESGCVVDYGARGEHGGNHERLLKRQRSHVSSMYRVVSRLYLKYTEKEMRGGGRNNWSESGGTSVGVGWGLLGWVVGCAVW